jgi:hypothetical protein
MGRADHSILDKYDEVRRSIYWNFIDPVSTSNFMRVSTSDPETILEKDPVMATFARMHDDSKIRDDFDRVWFASKYICRFGLTLAAHLRDPS